MKPQQLHDRTQLEAYFRRDLYLHLYSLGDLDDFYWPNTRWYGISTAHGVDRVVLIYTGGELPVLLAFLDPGEETAAYLQSLIPILPDRFYAHLSPGLKDYFQPGYQLQAHGPHYKMGLLQPEQLGKFSGREVESLSLEDQQEIVQLYQESYPGNWFDSRLLQTGQYRGIRRQGRLCSIAGVHVYSPSYRIAALGNITTHPDYRNQSLGKIVTAALCRSLLQEVDAIGLNVRQDNPAALACYRKIGFKVTAQYGEYTLQRRK